MRQSRSYFVFAAFTLPALFFLQNPQTVQSIHTATLTAVKPAVETGNHFARFLVDSKDSLIIFWKTFRQNQFSQDEITRLQAEILQLKEMGKENVRLKALLDFKNGLSSKAIAARVIGWDPSLIRKMILLDKGKNHGIKKDMPLVVSQGLVGRVLETGPSSSRAILLIDPEARVSAVTSESRAQGVVAGDGSRKLKLMYLDLESGVQIGENVVTSGVGQLFFKGMNIGKISSIQRSPDGLHLEASLEPYVPFTKLEEIVCLDSSRSR